MEVVAEQESLQPRQLPEFDVSFRDTLPTFYFHHIIDPIAATLRVEVLGPNLAYTFRHDRAKEQRLSASTIFTRLERKTTGFLALRADTGKKRVVLAWAESGNGAGPRGDLLDPEPSVLPNDVWTQRVISMGKILGLRMRRPFDGRLSRVTGQDMTGIFLGGHVEAKLAVHAVFVLLNKFGITQDLDNVSLKHLKGLRSARWEDGSRPSFEIYFSRKNCNFCGKFVRTLQKATGIRLKLVWRDRLVKIVYDKRPLPKMNLTNRPQPQEAIDVDIDIDINDCETLMTDMTDEVHVIDLIDLSRDHRSAMAEIINLTGDSSHNNTNSGSTPSEQGPHGRSAVDTYIDGLAYCVGQIEQCPAGAQAAILEFAGKFHQQRGAASRRAAAALVNISKPLPATPQTAPPSSDIAEAWGAENALLTPPSSGRRWDGWTNGDGPRASLNRNGTDNLRSAAPQIGADTPSLVRPRTRLELRKDRDVRRRPALVSASHSQPKRTSFCIDIPSRLCSSSPDPF
ncbi:hypothetical protein ACHAQJ_000414 [Trichoderma viride]